jgi:hypothetical protein
MSMTDPPIRHALPIDNTMLTANYTIKFRAAADGGFESRPTKMPHHGEGLLY